MKDFKDEHFFYFINNKKNEELEKNNNNMYIIKLYKYYKKLSSYINYDYETNKKLLTDLEDKVYTTFKEKMLNDVSRIKLELELILENLKTKDGKLSNDVITEISDLVKKYQYVVSNPEDKEMILFLKKKISILQAKIGLDIKFFEASYLAFLEIYRKNTSNKDNVEDNEILKNKFRDK